MRNKKYGERTLSLLREKNKTLILEIDPPYHKEGKGFPLEIMTYPKLISKDIFDTFSTYHKNKVMKNVHS